MNCQGKIALITGAARRLGRQIALELADAGCDVAIHYRTSKKEASSLVNQIEQKGSRAIALPGDLLDAASWPALIDGTVGELGALDVLVNNASTFLTNSPDTIDGFCLDTWDRMLRVNLTAAAGLVHHAKPHLGAADGGRIVNLCDIAVDRPDPSHLAYVCSKAALVSLTTALALDLAPMISVNGVAPGIAMFPDSYDEDTRIRMARSVPLGRAGTPADIAQAVRFLIESGDYITGQVIHVDGGRLLR